MPENETRTRRELDAALRELLREGKPLAQLRVRELTERCGLRRQSFYYHFLDVYDLFDWSVRRERECLLALQEECLTWGQCVLVLLDRAAEERTFYQAVLERRGRLGLREMIPLSGMLETVQRYYQARSGQPSAPEEDRRNRRCAETVLLSLLEGWLQGDLEMDAREAVEALRQAVERGVAGAVWQTLLERGERIF
ncbi:MAG: hypothetical protein HFG00_09160 [Oscillibacter sp.]|nr:hypothetical protein [Oscillibacter sp.]